MSFKSFLAQVAEKCNHAAGDTLNAAFMSTKATVDQVIARSAELEHITAGKLNAVLQKAASYEASASHYADTAVEHAKTVTKKAYHDSAKLIQSAQRQLESVQKNIKSTFTRKHVHDVIEKCPLLKKGRDEAREEAKKPEEIKLQAAEAFLSGDYNKGYLSKPSEDKFGKAREFTIGAETKQGGALLVYKSGDLKQTVLGGEIKKSATLKVDWVKHEVSGKLGVEVAGAVYKVEDKKSLLHGLAVVKGKGEVLSAKASAEAELEFSAHGGKVTGELGAEANLVKGELSGELRITPKTLWDNTGGNIFGCEAPDWLDYGLSGGAKGEAGIGAAAKVSGGIEATSSEITATVEAKLGIGPMAGLKLSIGFTSPEED